MGFDVDSARRELVGTIQSLGKPGGNAWLQSYVGSPYPVLGLTTPQARSVLRDFRRTDRVLVAAELNALAKAMWSGPTFEEKSMAIALLSAYPALLNGVSWKLADRWVDEAIGWALSDGLAAGPISTMVYPKPGRYQQVLRWTKSDHFWRRRAATYAMHNYVFADELDKPFQLLEKLLYDDEFWVQRAVGTWLRECWKKESRRTERFLRQHARGLPPVVITVATERASMAFREELRRKRLPPRRGR